MVGGDVSGEEKGEDVEGMSVGWWGLIDWLKPGHKQKCEAFVELTGTLLSKYYEEYDLYSR